MTNKQLKLQSIPKEQQELNNNEQQKKKKEINKTNINTKPKNEDKLIR